MHSARVKLLAALPARAALFVWWVDNGVYASNILPAVDVHEHLARATAFEWDTGNREKNWLKHEVSVSECEQAFFNRPLVSAPGSKRPAGEERFYSLGRTNAGRPLFVVFTLRGTLIRIISARDMSRKERKVYESV